MSAVGALARTAYDESYPGLPADYLAEIEAVAERARTAQVWVAEDDATGAILGTVTLPEPGQVLSAVARDGEIDVRLLAVVGIARGRGVGGLLMRLAIDTARERGASRLVLNTSTEMPGARRLYERMGFHRLFEREEDIVREDGSAFTLLAYGFEL
nr:GNAT family N-acetyltransferase [Leucobacter exalbidus]